MPSLVHSILMVSGIVCVGLGLVLFGLWLAIDSSLWMGRPAKARAIRLDYRVNLPRSALMLLGMGCMLIVFPLGPLAGVDRDRLPAPGERQGSLRDHRTESGEGQAAAPEQEGLAGKTAHKERPGSETVDIAGEWTMINTILDTQYAAYKNLQLGFRLWIRQQGNAFEATGEKYLENGRPIPPAARRPITIQGTLKAGAVIEATFAEAGLRRQTTGRFHLTRNDPYHLRGTFVSTAAGSRGSSQWTRVK